MKYRKLLANSILLATLGIAMQAHAALAQPFPVEPVALPPAVEQGVDMVYIDPEIDVDIRWRNTKLNNDTFARFAGAPLDLIQAINPLYTDLRRALVAYQKQWGAYPQFAIDPGPPLRPGDDGERVAKLRERLGLPSGTHFDEALAKKVALYQQVHGLNPDGVVGDAVVASLNLGAEHYEHVLMINMERARRLPAPGELKRHIIVDAGSATISMYEDSKLVGSMRAVVGTNDTQTPMMAALIRYADVNPNWNVPSTLIMKMVAPRVLAQGVGYLTERKYQVFANWSENSPALDPASIDWQAVKDGKLNLRVRRGPGPGNSMGDIKFMMPNTLGIYLHDSPEKALFRNPNRWLSNGCVRVEDAHRLAAWLFGAMPQGHDPSLEEKVPLAEPVPVFITYITVAATQDGVVFRADPYHRDAAVLARYFGKEDELAHLGH